MTRLVVGPTFSLELADAVRAYELNRAGIGRELALHVDEALRDIRRFPDMAAIVAPAVRRVILHRFPFCLVYRLKGNEVQLLALIPTRADADRTYSRLTAFYGRTCLLAAI